MATITLRSLGIDINPTVKTSATKSAFNHICITLNDTHLFFYDKVLFCVHKNGVTWVTDASRVYFNLGLRNVGSGLKRRAAKKIADSLAITSMTQFSDDIIRTREHLNTIINEQNEAA